MGLVRRRAKSCGSSCACPWTNGPVPPTWRVRVKGDKGQLVPLAELGRWETTRVDQMIYKNLQRVAYVFAETAGRPPADVVVDVMSDEADNVKTPTGQTRWQRMVG